MQLNRYLSVVLLSVIVFCLFGSLNAVEAATGRCTSFTVTLNADPASYNKSASQSDQFNIKSSYAVSNIIPRLPQPGEPISFSATGEGVASGFWALPVGYNPDDPCSYYVWTSSTGTFPNWRTGTLKRNDRWGASCTQTLNFDRGVIFGTNYTINNGSSNSWCRNVDPNTTQGYLYNGSNNTGGRCTNTCVIQAMPNFSRTYTFNAVPVCPTGTYLNTDVQAALAVWPGANGQQLNWSYSPAGRSTRRTMNLTSTYAGSRFYMVLRTTTGTAFQPVGNVPHPGINYQQNWNPPTWNASGSIGIVPNGTYTINYQVPSQFCSPPTAPDITSVSCNANGQVTINWRSVPGASGYAFRAHNTHVSWDNCANTNGNSCNNISGSQTSFTFNGSPGKTYRIWMHSMYDSTFGP
jgi:hypothetical protein